MQTIKKVDAWTAAKVQAVMMVIFGLIIGVFVAIIMGLTEQVTLWMLIALPFLYAILYGFIGFITGGLGAAIYNGIAKSKIGGIKIELGK
ncbi:MAG: hypothetical protein ABIB43_01855 [archaeon]|nr:hypothetical protein [Nanoarchaeota archaeon]